MDGWIPQHADDCCPSCCDDWEDDLGYACCCYSDLIRDPNLDHDDRASIETLRGKYGDRGSVES